MNNEKHAPADCFEKTSIDMNPEINESAIELEKSMDNMTLNEHENKEEETKLNNDEVAQVNYKNKNKMKTQKEEKEKEKMTKNKSNETNNSNLNIPTTSPNLMEVNGVKEQLTTKEKDSQIEDENTNPAQEHNSDFNFSSDSANFDQIEDLNNNLEQEDNIQLYTDEIFDESYVENLDKNNGYGHNQPENMMEIE